MKPKWLIENFVGDNGYESLIAEVKRQGFECVVLDVTNHFTLRPNLIVPGECVVFQGSIQLFRKLKEELDAYPIGWMTDLRYLCSHYYSFYQEFLFNDKHAFITVGDLKKRKWEIYSRFGREANIFVRPDGGDKLFKGQLIDLQDFDKFFKDKNSSCNAVDTDLVVVSTPKTIVGEWRFICTDKQEIVAVSCYQYQGQRTYIPSAPEKATELCRNILKVGYHPDPVFTVDICEDADGNYWLMEFNSFTSAGTYEANKTAIVAKVSEIAECIHSKKYSS